MAAPAFPLTGSAAIGHKIGYRLLVGRLLQLDLVYESSLEPSAWHLKHRCFGLQKECVVRGGAIQPGPDPEDIYMPDSPHQSTTRELPRLAHPDGSPIRALVVDD